MASMNWPGNVQFRAVVVAGICLFVPGISTALAQPPAPAAQASVPRVVRIDGVFVPAAGTTATAMETVTLSLHDAASGGTLLWEEVQIVPVGQDGRYTAYLGATRPDGLPAATLSGDLPRWLGVRFARGGDEPRVPLTSVPYALRASDADTLGGLPPSAFLRADLPESGTAATSADGASTSTGRTTPPLVNTGTANFIGKFVDATDLTSSLLYDSGSRIGLGTTSPLDIFHSRFTDSSGSLTGLAVQNLSNSASAYSGMLFYDHTGALGQFQGFNNVTKEYRINNIASGGSINFMLSSQSRFRVRPDGDIDMPGNIYKGQFMFLRAGGSGSTHSIGLGEQALNNGLGLGNIAIGSTAIGGPGSGGITNIGIGNAALYSNAGTGNIAVGSGALGSSTGNYTIAIGDQAGSSKFGANNYNVYLGASVGSGGATESGTIRVGDTPNYLRFFAGGIRGVTTGSPTGVNVVIDSQGQLGTISSSRRFKTDIQDMAEASSRLMLLRPVTYRYKQSYADGSMPIDYGLIAEEVAEIYPDIVVRNADGEIETVQYHKVNAMLLNEVQKQYRDNQAQQREIDELRARLATLERLLATDRR
ncbi:MAG: tail fiber domain-containing protein [Acidobacteria bacterium]|nr:tail fiber domain-containing protein [Acidobacteriota bacterium]